MDNYITKIKINKVRHLKNIEIDLGNEKKHLILTGKNGSGKTSVLEELEKQFLISTELSKNSNLHLEIKNIDNKFYQQIQNEKIDFIYSFFEAKRGISKMREPRGIQRVIFPKNKTIRLNGEFLQYILNLKADKSFARDDEEFITVKEIDSWFKKFQTILEKIFNDQFLKLKFNRRDYSFRIKTKDREASNFNNLSAGYTAIIDIITELLMQIENTESKSFDCQGIVLIDEIETHLHIELQKNILPLLTTFFPNIQFIVTTHSPFVLSSLSNTVIYDLENNIRVEDLSEASYTGLVRKFFGIDSEYSKILENKFGKFEKLAKKENLNKEEKRALIKYDIDFQNLSPLFSPEICSKYLELRRVFLR